MCQRGPRGLLTLHDLRESDIQGLYSNGFGQVDREARVVTPSQILLHSVTRQSDPPQLGIAALEFFPHLSWAPPKNGRFQAKFS